MNTDRIIKLLKIDISKCFSEKIVIVMCFFIILCGFAIPLVSAIALPLLIFVLSMKDLKAQQLGIDCNLAYSLPVKKSEIVIEKFLLQFLCMLITLPAYIYIATVSLETAIYVFLVTLTSSMIVCSILTTLIFVFELWVPVFIGIMIPNLLLMIDSRFILYLDSDLPLDAVPFTTVMLVTAFIVVPISIFISIKAIKKKQLI